MQANLSPKRLPFVGDSIFKFSKNFDFQFQFLNVNSDLIPLVPKIIFRGFRKESELYN